jgi:hypothetical protein
MKSKLVELLHSGDKDQFRIQYDEENGELYVNDKKVAYEVALTKWQNILAVSVSLAVIFEAIVSILTFFFKDFDGLMKIF